MSLTPVRCSYCKVLKPAREFSDVQLKKSIDPICIECISPTRTLWQKWLPTVLGVVFLASLGAIMMCQHQIPKLNMTDLLHPSSTIRQAFEDADEWRKSVTKELYKDVTESELAKAVRWIRHADPFSRLRSCSSVRQLFQIPKIHSLMSKLKDLTWSPEELKDLITQYVYHTAGLDGNRLSLPETREVIEHKKCEHCDTAASEAIKEVKNIDQVLHNYPLFSPDSKDVDITMQTLIDLNSAILHDLNVPLGLRKHEHEIQKKKLVLPKPDEVLHLTEQYVAWLRENLNNLKPDDVAAAIQLACDAHTRFLHIFPFSDGNGREARVLSALVLRKAGLPPAMILRDLKDQYTEAIYDAIINNSYRNICQIYYDGVINMLEHMNTLAEKRSS